jgi:hypothetical protein
MAKLSDKVMKEAQEALRDGTRLPTGVCLDFSRNPAIFACSELDKRVARGEVSVSYDGTQVLDLKTGEMTAGEPIDRSMPVTLMEMADASGGNLPAATNADTVTTDNAPAGGRGRATR